MELMATTTFVLCHCYITGSDVFWCPIHQVPARLGHLPKLFYTAGADSYIHYRRGTVGCDVDRHCASRHHYNWDRRHHHIRWGYIISNYIFLMHARLCMTLTLRRHRDKLLERGDNCNI